MHVDFSSFVVVLKQEKGLFSFSHVRLHSSRHIVAYMLLQKETQKAILSEQQHTAAYLDFSRWLFICYQTTLTKPSAI